MKLFYKGKDGGAESKVFGWWLIEIKALLSIAFLKFEEGSREAFHTHAFYSVSWVLWGGGLKEEMKDTGEEFIYKPSFKPVLTPRDRFHRVHGIGKATYVLTFRGPWLNRWLEFLPASGRRLTLTHGRKVVSMSQVKRVWVNAPSMHQQYHLFHGQNALFVDIDGDQRIYFLSGGLISSTIDPRFLADGWKTKEVNIETHITMGTDLSVSDMTKKIFNELEGRN